MDKMTTSENIGYSSDRSFTATTDISANEYQYLALRTESDSFHCEDNRLLQGLMGLAGEAGEAIDILKKHIFQGHDLDKRHIALELGDVAWYLALAADAIGYDLGQIFNMNVDKLRKRYPNGFEAQKSVERDDVDI